MTRLRSLALAGQTVTIPARPSPQVVRPRMAVEAGRGKEITGGMKVAMGDLVHRLKVLRVATWRVVTDLVVQVVAVRNGSVVMLPDQDVDVMGAPPASAPDPAVTLRVSGAEEHPASGVMVYLDLVHGTENGRSSLPHSSILGGA